MPSNMHLSQVITEHGTWLQLSTTFGWPLINHGFSSMACLPGHSAYSFLPMPWSIFLQYQTHISMFISLRNTTNWIFLPFGDIFFLGGGGRRRAFLFFQYLGWIFLFYVAFLEITWENFIFGFHRNLFKPLKLNVIFCLHLCLPS